MAAKKKRKVSQKTLAALKRGRKTMAANRRAKKKAPARRRNPTARKPLAAQGMLSIIRISAPNTPNGNPRRLYLVYEHGHLVGIYDDDYMGDGALPSEIRQAYAGHTIKVAAAEYNRLNKIRKGNQYHHNPAHGNFMNAIAAKARGGLGREAYQNPVRPLRKKNMLPLRNVPPQYQGYIIVRLTSHDTVEYWNGVKFAQRKSRVIFVAQKDALAFAKKFKLPGYVAVVRSYLSGTEIQAALISRRDA